MLFFSTICVVLLLRNVFSLRLLQRNADLLITDVNMPNKSGIEAAAEVRFWCGDLGCTSHPSCFVFEIGRLGCTLSSLTL